MLGIVELKDLKQSGLISLGKNFDCCPAHLGDLVTPAYGYPSRDTRVLLLVTTYMCYNLSQLPLAYRLRLTGADSRVTGDNLQCWLTVADVI